VTSRFTKLLSTVLVLLMLLQVILILQGMAIMLMLRPPARSVTRYDAEDVYVLTETLTPAPDDMIYVDDGALVLSHYTFSLLPESDSVLFIDWLHSITITDALSQTTVISGPAIVRFGNER